MKHLATDEQINMIKREQQHGILPVDKQMTDEMN